jgi:hypothetical protein
MAFLGADGASAALFCKTEPAGEGGEKGRKCTEGWAYPAATELHGVRELEPYTTTTMFKTVECEESTIKAVTEKEGGGLEHLHLPVGALTIGKCNCEVKIIKAGTLEIGWIPGSGNGVVTSSGLEETLNCATIFGNVHCIYVTNETELGTLTGGNPGTLDVTAEVRRSTTSSLCDEKAVWHAKYKIESPKPLYVAAET